MYEFEITNAAYKLLKELNVKAGESIAITCDTKSDMDIVNAVAKAAVTFEAKPLVLKTPSVKLPVKPFVATVRGCEVWVEINGEKVNGTEAYEKIMAAPAPRYACLSGVCRETLIEKIACAECIDAGQFCITK